MNELMDHIAEESRKGYHCSNTLVRMALEMKGSENPELVAATSALAGGVGFTTRHACGCLTGGLCMLGLFICKGDDDQEPHPQEREITGKFVEWFESEIGGKYGSCVCSDIIGPDAVERMSRCPGIIRDTYLKVAEMLEEFELVD